jgi:carbamoyltransferase
MRILGISAFYHDSAAALIKDGEIIAAAQEERFTRKKHDAGFPSNAIKFCLDFEGIGLEHIDAVVFYDKPLLKFERLLETYYSYAPKGIVSFVKSMPVWIKQKMFLKKVIKDDLLKLGEFDSKKTVLQFPEHHLSHAASAFYPSNYQEAAILTIDGVGEWATASICHGKDKQITILSELKFPHSLGLLYSAFTYYLGFRVNSGEYKLMGLAPYGNLNARTQEFVNSIKNELVKIYEDGSIWLNQKYFNYSTGLRMVHDKKWESLFKLKRREAESEIEQIHCDMGLAIQIVTEEIVIKMAKEAKRLTGAKNLCMAGGVALNCVVNGKLLNEGIFENIFFQPAAGDAGGAIGAALASYHISYNQERVDNQNTDLMKGGYLGPKTAPEDIKRLINKYDAKATHYKDYNQLTKTTANLLANGNIIGWVQGRMEFGPRALGGRSILADPRNPEMQKKLNLKIKYRESFRPFAPSVLINDVSKYFDMTCSSPYMMLVQPLIETLRKPKPEGYEEMAIKEKLYFERSTIPSITHIDYSARIQTVHEETNPRYYQLIEAFKAKTGVGMLVNTSFNVRGEPIVCSAEDAYRCFMRTEMDFLVIGDYLFDKTEQPKFANDTDFLTEYSLD